MVMDTLTPVPTIEQTVTRPLGVCGYVDRGLHEVTGALEAASAGSRVGGALATALHLAAPEITVDLRGPVVVSDRVAHLHLRWSAEDGRTGQVKLSILAVRSGRDALTELLVSVPVDDASSVGTAHAARRFLQALEADLA